MAQGKSFDMKEEFAGLDFHSVRLEQRFIRFIRTMDPLIQQPDASIWEASEGRAEAKAIYRMLANESLTGRRSSGHTGKQRYGGWPNMAVRS
ncbi:MAG: hypothetical protein LBF74_08490 [Treponema sp.]|jgi:hypothetical protein|nr:hypothetical protein [Treponema sp.]